jgi:signal transduction histidine kinase/ligand-binding sensor domain-containing protein
MSFWRRSVGCGLMLLLLPGVRSALALDPHRLLNQYGRQVWQTGEGPGESGGLPQNTVRSVVQTTDGYVWLATDDGLVRFNGNEFKVFTAETTPELRSSAIEGLTADPAGRLWVVTTGGLTLYAEGRFRVIGTGEGLPDAEVWFAHQDSQRRVWVATAGGLCVMRTMRCEPVAATKGMSVTGEGRFAEGADGSIWLADGAETVRLDGRSLTQTARATTSNGAEIVVQQVAHDGRLLVGTRDRLQVLDGGAFVPIALPVAGHVGVNAMALGADGSTWFGTSAGLLHGAGTLRDLHVVDQSAVQTLFVDRVGAVWAGTERGVVRVVGERVETFHAGDALAGSSLLALLEDREGNMWLGTEADGLTELHEQKFTTYTTAEGLSGNVVRSVLQDAAGTVWVGTDGAGLNRKTADGFVAIGTKQGLSSDVVLALASGASGELWVGTPTGLNRLRGSAVQVFTTADGLADDFIRSLLVDRAGDVWVGTRHGLTRIAVGGGMTTYTTLDGLGGDFIGVIVEGKDGDLWIGTSGGLTRLVRAGNKERFRNYTMRDGLKSNVVTAMLPDGSGGLWLGGDGTGLSYWSGDGGGVERLGTAGLPASVFGILKGEDGALWISSRSGIFRLTLAGPRSVTAYDTADGMRIREGSSGGHPAAWRMRDGTLWFATLRGVSVVDPANLHENKVVPSVAIETVLVNDVPQAKAGGELVLAPGSQRVEFQYAGLSFVAPQKVRYRYWLEGSDPAWVDAGANREAFYTNLRPKQYVFHVMAANNDGVWSSHGATMRVRVRPFFWQTWWFYGLLVLVAAAVAYLAYAWRLRRVAARYKGVMEERSRIAREIHDGLAQGIVSISLQLEVVTRLMGSSVEAARAQLDETRALVRQSLTEARSSIWDLRSEGAEELPVRLGRALKLLTAPAGIAGKMEVTGSYRAAARGVEDELLKIGQEAVTNAVRHAGCSAIEVMLAYDMKRLRMTVVDDGSGFDLVAEAPAGHFGLQGMRERAKKIGARLEVVSAMGEGTRLVVELGLK